MSPDRKKMPVIREMQNLVLPRPEVYHLSNGTPVYDTFLGTQDVAKLELVFNAGRSFEHKKLVSRATSALLREGTASYTSSDIAEIFDYYGATISTPPGMDVVSISVVSLKKHFEKLLPVIAEILSTPTFPEKELLAFIERNKRRLKIDITKNDVLAYRKFTELIFGENHPYGYNSQPETYDDLRTVDLETHFRKNFTAENCKIFLSGKTGKYVVDLLDKYLGDIMLHGEKHIAKTVYQKNTPTKLRLEHENSVQTAIKIGGPLFDRKHEDYNGFYILNTILGGYFGSRLMHNVREDKGFTYNIYSTFDALALGGFFYVGTEVGNDFVEQTLREIYSEMEKLCSKTVGKTEMQMVRNYLLGTLLTNLDGAFNISEVIKSLICDEKELSDYEQFAEDIRTISPKQLKTLAQKYFNQDELWEVIA
jgi:predicted Zn-dependent peptidase